MATNLDGVFLASQAKLTLKNSRDRQYCLYFRLACSTGWPMAPPKPGDAITQQQQELGEYGIGLIVLPRAGAYQIGYGCIHRIL